MQTLSLRDSIMTADHLDKQEDRNILERFCELIKSNNIRWTTKADGTDPWFIASDLSTAKGLDPKDYTNHWSNAAIDKYNRKISAQNEKLTSSGKSDSLKPLRSKLRGREWTLMGDSLSNFKRQYFIQHQQELGRVNSLTLVNWRRAYAYMTKGHSEVTGDFDELGADAVEELSKQKIAKITEVNRKVRYAYGLSEQDIQLALHNLSGFCGSSYILEPEVTVEDFPQSRTDCRRFDLVHWEPHPKLGKIVTLYEVKKDIATLEDTIQVMEGKRYKALAEQKYAVKRQSKKAKEKGIPTTPHVKIILVAPYGGTPEAEMKVAEYRAYGHDIDIWTVATFTSFLLRKAYQHHKLDPYVVREFAQRPIMQKLISIPSLPAA